MKHNEGNNLSRYTKTKPHKLVELSANSRENIYDWNFFSRPANSVEVCEVFFKQQGFN